ncbi:hypothetical protein, partial [Nocardia abscessus]|uniref:hypothetical protein n=1 Tax=Nocardia abscessus TaxID=120957 RepID=UPI002457A6F2
MHTARSKSVPGARNSRPRAPGPGGAAPGGRGGGGGGGPRATRPPPGDFRAPGTDLERAVCTGFAEILAAERVGLNDNF